MFSCCSSCNYASMALPLGHDTQLYMWTHLFMTAEVNWHSFHVIMQCILCKFCQYKFTAFGYIIYVESILRSGGDCHGTWGRIWHLGGRRQCSEYCNRSRCCRPDWGSHFKESLRLNWTLFRTSASLLIRIISFGCVLQLKMMQFAILNFCLIKELCFIREEASWAVLFSPNPAMKSKDISIPLCYWGLVHEIHTMLM